MTTVHSSIFTGYTFMSGRGSRRRQAAQAIKSMPILQELMLTLNGAAAGSTALVQRARIQAVEGQAQGGSRDIETVDLINRATTSTDKTDIDNDILSVDQYDDTPARNLNHNPLGSPGLFT